MPLFSAPRTWVWNSSIRPSARDHAEVEDRALARRQRVVAPGFAPAVLRDDALEIAVEVVDVRHRLVDIFVARDLAAHLHAGVVGFLVHCCPPDYSSAGPPSQRFTSLGLDAEQVEQAADGVVDDVVDGLRLVVERRHDRRDHRADVGERRQRAQVPAVQRRLAQRQHQAALLLQHHVGGARDAAMTGHAGRDLAHGADRARHDRSCPWSGTSPTRSTRRCRPPDD